MTAETRGRRAARSLALAGTEPFLVELDRFRGPLDLLLHLIRSQDIDIFDIPIARITEQFQSTLEAGIEAMELDRAGEFIEMAATLVRIKSQLLLPRSGEREWEEDPRADLVRRLLEYEHFREVAQVLSSAEADRSRHFGKGWVEPRSSPGRNLSELATFREELLEAARGISEPEPEPVHQAPVRTVTVEEKMSLVRRLFRNVRRLAFEKLFGSGAGATRPHGVAALLAVLELARRQVVRIEQTRLFGSIWLLPGKAAESEAEADGAEAGSGGERPEAVDGAANGRATPVDPSLPAEEEDTAAEGMETALAAKEAVG